MGTTTLGDDRTAATAAVELPRPRPEPWARARVLVPLYAVLAAALTWPLVAHITDSLTYGTEPVGTVPRFNLWTMRWNQDRIGALFRGYWDAPIFHPTDGAFALSEPQPLTGLVFAPISWISGNPVLAYNVVLLAILAANGWAAARLARTLGAAAVPALLVGVLAEGMPFVATQLGVLQLTVVFPLFLLADAIVRWAAVGGRRPAAEIGLWLAATFLTCGYYGLFAVLAVGPPALVFARRSWLSRARLLDLGAAAGVFAVLALPFLVGQARFTSGYSRPERVIRGLSASTRDFWKLDGEAHGVNVLPWVGEATGSALYPGTALLALGLVGFAIAHYRFQPDDDAPAAQVEDGAPAVQVEAGARGEVEGGERGEVEGDAPGAEGAAPGVAPGAEVDGAAAEVETDGDGDREGERPTAVEAVRASDEGGAGFGTRDDRRRQVLFLVIVACLTRLLSLGLNLSIFGFRPYRVIRDVVPGYDSLRSPYRFGVLTEIFLAALAAYALDALWRWRPRRLHGRIPWPAVAAVLIVAVGMLEVSIAPIRLFRVDQDPPDWAAWLADHPHGDDQPGDGSVAFVPFPPNGHVESYEPTTVRMLQSLDAGVPTVNGYSGLFPSAYDEMEAAMRVYPTDQAEALLRDRRVSYLVVDEAWLNADIQRSTWLADHWRTAFVGDDAVIYEARQP